MGVVAALYALYKAYDKANITAEEQLEIFNDLNSEYEATKSEIESLESSLKSIRERIEELQAVSKNGIFSSAQTEELAQLEAEEESLKRQLEIKQRLAEAERKAAEKAAADTLSKRTHTVEGKTVRRGSEVISSAVNLGDADAINYYIEKLKWAKAEKERLENEIANPASTDAQRLQYDKDISQLEADMISYDAAISTIVSDVQPLIDSITATTGATAEQKQEIIAAIDNWLEFGKATDQVVVGMQKLTSVSNLTSPSLSTHIDNMKAIEETIGKLSDALASFRDDGIVTMDIFSDLSGVFAQCPDELEHFVNVAGNSKSTMSEVQSAANLLAEAYLNSTDFLQNLTDGTIDATIAKLKHIGVVNAEEVVMQRMAAARAEEILAAEKMTDVTWKSAVEVLREAGAAESDIEALHALRVAHLNAQAASIDFATANVATIRSLIDTANAAGIAAEELNAVIQLEKMKAQIGTGGLTGTEYLEKVKGLAKQADAEIAAIKAKYTYTDIASIQIGVAPTSKSSSSSGKDANQSAFEAKYNAMKHELEMEKITLREFYAWLDGENGYRKYFKDQKKYADEWQKYSKEVFDGMRQVHEQYLSVLDYEISMLERQENTENDVIAKYTEKRAEIQKLIDALYAYLAAEGMTELEILSNEEYRSLLDKLHTIEDEVASIQEEAYEKQQGYVNDLIDLTEEYIKQLGEDEIDALEEQKDRYSELIQLQKDLINGAREDEKYEREKAEKLKEMQKLQERITALGLDGSREAMLEQGKLLEELNTLQIELDDLQKDHYVDSAEKALDDEEKAFHDAQDAKIKEIEDFLDDNRLVNQEAINQLEGMNQEMFDNLLEYALHYTDTTRSEMLAMWDEVTAAAEKYGSVTNVASVYEDSDVNNKVKEQINRLRENGQEYARTTDASRKEWLANDSLKAGAELQELLGVTVERVNGTWYIGDGANRRKLFEIYHTGAASVGGSPTLKQNEVFAKLENTETVLTQKHMNNLWEMLRLFNPANWVSSPLSKLRTNIVGTTSAQNQTNIEVTVPLTLYGKMDDSVLDVLHRHGRDVANLVAAKIKK